MPTTSKIVRNIAPKLTPSFRAKESISRPNLLQRLNSIIDQRFIYITAPAGYGKTFLTGEWYQKSKSLGLNVAWLSFDEKDNDEFTIISVLCRSLARLGIDSEELENISDQAFYGMPLSIAFSSLYSILEKIESPIIILDDCHLLNKESINIIENVLEEFPSNVHFIINSRENIFSDLHYAHKFYPSITLTIEDLKFTKEEINAFLELKNTNFDEDDNHAIFQKTEGWPIAIEMAVKWAKGRSGRLNSIRLFSGRKSEFASYLASQIFISLSNESQEIFKRISIADRFTGDLVNVLCETDDGWGIIEDLHNHSYIFPLDDEDYWFRFHSLFSEFLKDKLMRSNPKIQVEMHNKASHWFFEQGDLSQAIKHAWEGKNPELAAQLLDEAGGWRLVLDGRIGLLSSTLEKLPYQLIEENPRLKLAQIILLAKEGDVKTASHNFSIIRKNIIFKDDSKKDIQQLEFLVVDAFLASFEDRPQTQTSIAQMDSLRMEVPISDHFLQAKIENTLSGAYLKMGLSGEAALSAKRSMQHFRQVESSYGETFLYIHLGNAYFEQGRLREAEQTWKEGYEIAKSRFGENSDITSLLSVHLSAAYYLSDQLDDAVKHIESDLNHIEQSECWCDAYITAYTTAASIARLYYGSRHAQEIYKRAYQTAKTRDLPRLHLMMKMKEVSDLSLSGALTSAENLVSELGVFPEALSNDAFKVLSPLNAIEAAIYISHYMIATGEFDAARGILDDALINLKQMDNTRWTLEYFVSRALLEFLDHKVETALNYLNEALILSTFEKPKRVFLDKGDPMYKLLTFASRQPSNETNFDPKANFLKNLIEKPPKARTEGSGDSGLELFSRREKEVLNLLYRKLSNKQISSELNISENTVKFHLRQIFKKLDVKSRKDALSTAVERHLIG